MRHPRQHQGPGLGGTIGAPAFHRVDRSTRRYGDDGARALRLHDRQRGPHAVEDAFQVDINCPAKRLWLRLGQARDRFDHACVVDQHIQPPKARLHRQHRRLHLRPIRHVTAQRHRLRADL
ncbi:MAG: hypothetical protein ACD_54C00587G0001, partial [uncultured bacterium]